MPSALKCNKYQRSQRPALYKSAHGFNTDQECDQKLIILWNIFESVLGLVFGTENQAGDLPRATVHLWARIGT
jgi:hypothetical protein